MRDRRFFLVAIVAVFAITATACSTTDNTDSDPSDDQRIAAECSADAPDCDDMAGINTDGTGGGLPLAPPTDLSPGSGLVVDGGISVGEALAYDGSELVAVGGFVVSVDGEARLCSLLAESFPPQCGGESLVIANPEALVDLPLVEEGVVQWSDATVVLVGSIDDGVLTISSTSTA